MRVLYLRAENENGVKESIFEYDPADIEITVLISY